jgi:YVTN family beta-propeller protein
MSIQRVVIAGLIASLLMGMLEMAHGAIAGTGFWSPAVYIAATIVRGLQSASVPVAFQPLPEVTRIDVGAAQANASFTADGATAFVTVMGADNVTVIDMGQLAVVDSFKVGKQPMGLALLG